ncbi:MAG: glycosyltransferase family 1 protein [Anaerolineae bacterium]|nr:glycosyltransferase family 1 protein [Anaerolineae bacterium]
MRISILAFGTHGDVQPLVALGLGLQAGGHTVQIITQAEYYDFVTRYGLTCIPVTFDFRQGMEGKKKAGVQLGSTYRLVRQYMRQAIVEIWEAVKNTEAIIFSYMGRVPGIHIAEKLKVPTYMVTIHPHQMHVLYRNRYINDFGLPAFNIKGMMVNNLQEVIFMLFINEWRQKTLGLPSAPIIGNDRQITEHKIPILCTYSPSVSPKLADWPDWCHLTGYCFLNSPADWRPPAELTHFIAAGSPAVYIGFGSVTHPKVKNTDFTHLVLDALTQSQQRGILAAGWGKLGKNVQLPEYVFALDAVPHDWLFPQVAAVVHHGGVGTTAAGLRAGTPTVVIPFVNDEPFWAWRVHQLGVGPAGISLKELTAERLASAIQIAVHNTEIKERATALSQKIQSEDGVSRAIELFYQYL